MYNNTLEANWDAPCVAPPPPYMESNQWLDNVIRTEARTTPRRARREEEIVFLGHKIVWTRDGDRPLPQAIVDALITLDEYTRLPENWDSYGGRSLRAGAIPTTLQLLFLGHRMASLPRLHPLSDGGVGLTWHRGGCELEILVAANGTVEALFTDEDGEEAELTHGSPYAEAVSLVRKLFEAQ